MIGGRKGPTGRTHVHRAGPRPGGIIGNPKHAPRVVPIRMTADQWFVGVLTCQQMRNHRWSVVEPISGRTLAQFDTRPDAIAWALDNQPK